MIPNTSYNVSAVRVSHLPIGVSQIEGYHRGASNVWLQVFDTITDPQAGDIPIYQLPLTATSQFFEDWQTKTYNFSKGVYVAISSTEGTYTASANTMDIVVFTASQPITTSVVSSAGDASLDVWISSVSKLLYALQITETLGQDSYVLVYAQNTFTGTVGAPLLAVPVKANQTVSLYYGGGWHPYSKQLPSTENHNCFVCITTSLPPTSGAPTANGEATFVAVTN